MKHFSRALHQVGLATCIFVAAQAHAAVAPAIGISDVFVGSTWGDLVANVLWEPSVSVYSDSSSASSAVTTLRDVTLLNGTKPYAVSHFSDLTTTLTQTNSFTYQDYSTISAVGVARDYFTCCQAIAITGTISSTQNLTVHFNLQADGGYEEVASLFGLRLDPAMPTLYFGTSVDLTNLANLAKLPTTTQTAGAKYNDYAQTSIDLSAGSSTSFFALVAVAGHVSLSNFTLQAWAYHDPYSVVSVGAPHVATTYLGTTPVPEPETWALMLSGLLVLGCMAKRGQA